MPYAANNQISTSPIAGGIEITAQQYGQAIAGMQQGKLVTIDGGFALVDPPEPQAPPEPEPPTFEQLQAAKIESINAAFTEAAAALTQGYPPAEQLTWPVQQSEALAWGANDATPTPYLDGLAAARGIDPEVMRALTLSQVQLFMAASQQLVGTRQRLRDLALAATTPEELESIRWPEPAA